MPMHACTALHAPLFKQLFTILVVIRYSHGRERMERSAVML